MNDVVFIMLEAIVSVSVILVMRYVIPYLKMKLQSSIDETVLIKVLEAVKSVEQDPAFQNFLGREKKEEVICRIIAWANEHGINITYTQLSQLIETAVFTMKNEKEKNR